MQNLIEQSNDFECKTAGGGGTSPPRHFNDKDLYYFKPPVFLWDFGEGLQLG